MTIAEAEDGRQDFNGAIIGSNITLHDCEFALNSKVDDAKASSKTNEDDFEEDEEETEGAGARKMKLSNYQQLLCGMKPKIAAAIKLNKK